MCKISSNGYNTGVTVISNLFLDNFMPDSNEQDLKVYLYILRYANVPSAEISLKQIANTLDLTANKVKKSLKHWMSEGILEFTLDKSGEIDNIKLNDINALFVDREAWACPDNNYYNYGTEETSDESAKEINQDNQESINLTNFMAKDDLTVSDFRAKTDLAVLETSGEDISSSEPESVSGFVLPALTSEELFSIAETDTRYQKLFNVVEKLMSPKNLSLDDTNTLASIINGTNFDDELIIYLYDYCCNIVKKTSPAYISSVATDWASKNVTTVSDAKFLDQYHNGFLKSCRNELGISGGWGSSQIETIDSWIFNYGIDQRVVIEACKDAKAYAPDGAYKCLLKIIDSLHSNQVHTLDEYNEYQKKRKADNRLKYDKSGKAPSKQGNAYNQFNDFEQRKVSKEEAEKLEYQLINKNYAKGSFAALKASLKAVPDEG